jgi:hypothetical protein
MKALALWDRLTGRGPSDACIDHGLMADMTIDFHK